MDVEAFCSSATTQRTLPAQPVISHQAVRGAAGFPSISHTPHFPVVAPRMLAEAAGGGWGKAYLWLLKFSTAVAMERGQR